MSSLDSASGQSDFDHASFEAFIISEFIILFIIKVIKRACTDLEF
jgi:hypothetical protein